MKNTRLDSLLKKGKIITLASISVVIIILFFIILFGEVFSSASFEICFHFLFIANLSVSLYCGSKWAKWIIAIYLFVFGGLQVKYLLPPYDNISNLVWLIILFLLTASSFLFSIMLLFSKSVSNYVNDQYINRTDAVKNYLKYSWAILILLSIPFIYNIYKIFL